MTRRPFALVRAVLASVALLLLVVGIPVALVRCVGWPLPTMLPSLRQLADAAARDGIADRTIVKVLAVVVWLAWGQLTLAVAAEAAALRRHRPLRAVPATGAARRLAASLVSAIAVVLPAGAAMARPVTVAPGDTLWSISERELGAGEQWHQIWERNHGEMFGARTFDDPNLILPGWTLEIPEHAARQPGEALAVVSAPNDAAPDPAALAEPAALSGGPASALAPTDAVTVDGGETADSPPTPSAAICTPAPADVPGGASVARRVAGPGASVLFATGVAGIVAARRRRRARAAVPDEMLAATPPELVSLAETVQRASDSAFVARLDLALRAAAQRVIHAPEEQRIVVALRHADQAIELVAPQPLPGPAAPFRAGSSGWLLPASVPTATLASVADGRGVPTAPALVQLGRTAEGVGVFADLEAIGVLSIASIGARADAIARGIVSTLAISPLSDDVDVVTAGVVLPALGNRAVESLPTADEVLELLAVRSASLTAQLDQLGADSLLAARLSGPDGWPLTVGVIGASELPVPPVPTVRCGALVVAGDVPPARWRLVERGELLELQPLGLVVEPLALTRAELAEVAELIRVADAPPVRVDVARVDLPDVPPHEILVRMLGPLDVVDAAGHPATFERTKSLELLVWLALHRGNPSRLAVRTALWESDVRDATFANIVSDARRGLARLVAPPDGTEWLQRTYSDRLPLHDLVRSDADLLQAHVDRARQQAPHEAMASLRAGLLLVRDQPFAGAALTWPDAEALPSGLVVLATGAAARLASLALEAGDTELAFWATSVGLRVLPGHEELVCLRMEAHARAGDLAAVRAEFEAHERSVLADAWSDGAVAAKVVATRNRLLQAAVARPAARLS